jgi:hypothetical protein
MGKGTIREGTAGKHRLCQDAGATTDGVFVICSMAKAITGKRHAPGLSGGSADHLSPHCAEIGGPNNSRAMTNAHGGPGRAFEAAERR